MSSQKGSLKSRLCNIIIGLVPFLVVHHWHFGISKTWRTPKTTKMGCCISCKASHGLVAAKDPKPWKWHVLSGHMAMEVPPIFPDFAILLLESSIWFCNRTWPAQSTHFFNDFSMKTSIFYRIPMDFPMDFPSTLPWRPSHQALTLRPANAAPRTAPWSPRWAVRCWRRCRAAGEAFSWWWLGGWVDHMAYPLVN